MPRLLRVPQIHHQVDSQTEQVGQFIAATGIHPQALHDLDLRLIPERLRVIDLVVDLWYAQQPWHGVDRAEATARIIRRAIELVEASRPLLPGVREAVALCKGIKLVAQFKHIEHFLQHHQRRGRGQAHL